jgi:glycosyltransferase involved in cell wall biosynthesis
MAARIRGSRPLPNWTADLPVLDRVPTGNRTTLGYLGRISTDKGVDVLARAVAGLDDVDLVLAGDSRYVAAADVARVDAQLGSLGSRVRRLGHIAPADLFRSVDIVVFPSVWAEPFGLVVAEAMASGVPFVISDAGALPEVAGPDHPWVARSGDADDLAGVIGAALTAPADDVRAVTDRARRRWQAEYSPKAGRLRVRRLLEELAT